MDITMHKGMNFHYPRHTTPPSAPVQPKQGGISRLLSAAVVDTTFRNMLLTNPRMVLSSGYNGELFPLNREEQETLLSIRATSLTDFANQWIERQNCGRMRTT
jgi:hypothetical protein